VATLGASVTLALGIPVFMEKVMRPRYEERFEEFRQEGIEAFMKQFENALERFKRTQEIVTPETVGIMDSLFSQWDRIRTNEKRLQNLLKTRQYLFTAWMASAILSSFSIEYPNYPVPFLGEIRLGQLTQFVFFVSFLISFLYVLELFSLDQKLAGYGRTSRAPPPSSVPTYISLVYRGIEMGRQVESALQELDIPYEKRPISVEGRMIIPDFAIPSSDEPLYIVEVKTAIKSKTILYGLSDMLSLLRGTFPKVKGILVFDFDETPTKNLEMARQMWDFAVDFKRLKDLKNVIKL
jgi:hypothetical protein